MPDKENPPPRKRPAPVDFSTYAFGAQRPRPAEATVVTASPPRKPFAKFRYSVSPPGNAADRESPKRSWRPMPSI